jgi:hypothetical protein
VRVFAALAILLMCSGGVAAADAPMSGRGMGASSCREFAQRYTIEPTVFESSYFSWAQGAMTGLNLGSLKSSGTYRNLNGDVSAQQARIRRFCDQRPLASFFEAVIDLYNSLPVVEQKTPQAP